MNECHTLALFFGGGRTLDPTDVVHPNQEPGVPQKPNQTVSSPYPHGTEPLDELPEFTD